MTCNSTSEVITLGERRKLDSTTANEDLSREARVVLNAQRSACPPRAAEGATYRRALDASSRVASEEFAIATSALGEIEVMIERLSDSLSAITTRKRGEGAAIEETRGRLCELQARLETDLRRSMRETRHALARKHAALSRFTVTLFGRTMAGKSTIRETLTHGDGATISNGTQRWTRDVKRYRWAALGIDIIDTPGIGAYEGDQDCVRAMSVVEETDAALFLVSSDGLQEESFKGMQALRQQNKPMIFVLNVKRALTRRVFMERFLADPSTLFDPDEIDGHVARIQMLAGKHLGMRDIRVFPIHAQAAYLATRPEYRHIDEQLEKYSRIGELKQELEREILRHGSIRRIQTILDGTIVSMLDVQEELREQAKVLGRGGGYLREKLEELEVWLEGFVRATSTRIDGEVPRLLQPLRDSVSVFVDENLDRADAGARWQRQVETLDIDAWVRRQQRVILDELQAHLAEFTREMSVESKLIDAFHFAGPTTFDPWDVKRTLRWVSAGSLALAGAAPLLGMIGATNFWNPVGWIAGAVSVVTLGLSWLFGDREKKLHRQKAKASAQLHDTIDRLELRMSTMLKEWFGERVMGVVVGSIRTGTHQLYSGMSDLSSALDRGARRVSAVIERLNRRLLVRVGGCLGWSVLEDGFIRVVRDPGVRTKFLRVDARDDSRFCREVGRAIGEWVDGIQDGPLHQVVAAALQPASVKPAMVSVSGKLATVRIPRSEVGRAIGKRWSNLSLASRLVGLRIKVEEVPDG